MSCGSRVLMVIVGSVAYFSLAILGWGWSLAFRSGVGMLTTALLASEKFRARTSRLIPSLY